MNITETLTAAAEIRKLTIWAMEFAGYGQTGGNMSLCDMLAVLYTDILNTDSKNSRKENRDWLVLSKGRCGPALYATLAYKGFFNLGELQTLNVKGARVSSRYNRLKTNSVDISTGSLGHGLSVAAGIAWGNRLKSISSMVYIIVGNGELQEPQNWEAIQFIAQHELNNLVIIVDNNKPQTDDNATMICDSFYLKNKFTSLGINAMKADGHNVREIYDALIHAQKTPSPTALILDTEKENDYNLAEKNSYNHYTVVTNKIAKNAVNEINVKPEMPFI